MTLEVRRGPPRLGLTPAEIEECLVRVGPRMSDYALLHAWSDEERVFLTFYGTAAERDALLTEICGSLTSAIRQRSGASAVEVVVARQLALPPLDPELQRLVDSVDPSSSAAPIECPACQGPTTLTLSVAHGLDLDDPALFGSFS